VLIGRGRLWQVSTGVPVSRAGKPLLRDTSRENQHPNTGATLRGGASGDGMPTRAATGALAAVLRGHTNDGHSQERDGTHTAGEWEHTPAVQTLPRVDAILAMLQCYSRLRRCSP
jgi:hypothetical protein